MNDATPSEREDGAPATVEGGDDSAAWVATWEARRHFGENRARYPAEQLLPFLGQTVAWSADGTRILDAAPDVKTLSDKLVARGEDPAAVVFEYLNPI
jgi:hypothetical protein